MFRQLPPAANRRDFTFRCPVCAFEADYVIELPPHLRECGGNLEDRIAGKEAVCTGVMELISTKPRGGSAP